MGSQVGRDKAVPGDVVLPLRPYRCLDLTTEAGYFCGKILADLGCDVIKIEPPGGDPGHRRGPFYHHDAGPGESLYWLYYNSNKRGITLDLETGDGRGIFKQLAATADFLVESFPPGTMERLGLGYEALSQVSPRLIMASITPFGRGGPYQDFRSSELIAQATGGILFLSGQPEHPPALIGAPLAWQMVAVQTAVALLLAHYWRLRTSWEGRAGRGQHIDVSTQEAVTNLLIRATMAWSLRGQVEARGPVSLTGRLRRTHIWPCKDGYVHWLWWTGPGWGRKNVPLLEWMGEYGMAEGLLDIDYEALGIDTISPGVVERLETQVGRFFKKFTKAELYREAVRRQVMLHPVNSAKDILEDAQLQERGYWVGVEHPDLGDKLTFPGPLFRSTEYSPTVRRRAPRIGEHNRDIYQGELGLTLHQVRALREAGVI
jgi:crotonobetainyl-CoA:carnitine CoA-transferase CaiB-like acyl-CoA transferase